MRIFIDTSALMAVLNQDDRYHQPAKQTWLEILSAESTLFSSNYVLLETTALLQHRFGIEAVGLFDRDIIPILNIIWIDQTVHNLAVGVLLAANQRKLSLVDCTSFHIMRDANLIHVFSFDGHFADQGFTNLPQKY